MLESGMQRLPTLGTRATLLNVLLSAVGAAAILQGRVQQPVPHVSVVVPRIDDRGMVTMSSAYLDTLSALSAGQGDAAGSVLLPLRPGRQPTRIESMPVAHGGHVHFQVYGNEAIDAPTALFLHGGPGAGCFPNHARFFDLAAWRVVLLDQRGCGKSRPADGTVESTLRGNTLPTLVEDLESLRSFLGVSKWDVVHGGSWGCTLALAYAQEHPMAMAALVLRGVCTMSRKEILWLFGSDGGASSMDPRGWSEFASAPFVREEDRAAAAEGGVARAYFRAMRDGDPSTAAAAARGWSRWEGRANAIASRSPRPSIRPGEYRVSVFKDGMWWVDGVSEEELRRRAEDAMRARAPPEAAITGAHRNSCPSPQALLTSYYSVQALDSPMGGLSSSSAHLQPLLSAEKLEAVRRAGIACIMVQGGRDTICPPATAFELHRLWPEAQLRLCRDAGHSMYDPPITSELVKTFDEVLEWRRAGAPAASAPPPR